MFQTYLIDPLYNAFVFLIGLMPNSDAGLAIIALTIIIRIILYPLFTSSIRTQIGMQAMQAELEETKKQFENNKEALAKHQMELARKHKVNPLSMIGALIVQFGILIALYFALFREGFPEINQNLLYSWVHTPSLVDTSFFGLMDLLATHNIILVLIVAGTQYLAIKLTLVRTPLPSPNSDKHVAARLQQQMMLYFMPAMIGVVSYFFPAAVGLYFVTSNVFSIVQEWLIRKQQ